MAVILFFLSKKYLHLFSSLAFFVRQQYLKMILFYVFIFCFLFLCFLNFHYRSYRPPYTTPYISGKNVDDVRESTEQASLSLRK